MKLRLLFLSLVFLFSGFLTLTAQLRQCAANEMLEKAIQENPQLAFKLLEIEKHTESFIHRKNFKKPDNPGGGNGGGGGGGNPPPPPPSFTKVTIPVIVHVVYNTNAENITDAQINSQIQVLTKDFTASNSDYNSYVPAEYQGVKGNANIEFCLVQTIRVSTNRTSFGTNDDVKFTSRGGSDVVDPAHYLNVWVCDLSSGLLGYAQFPGGNSATDGIVCDYQAFGTTGTASAPFHKGRTATHEVGHYLNLRHIWGDRRCGNDFVDDTPLHDGANYGCPAEGATSNCKGPVVEMWMNYMDYTDDPCMYIFSGLQTARMRALLDPSGSRYGLLTNGCTAPATRAITSSLQNSMPAMEKFSGSFSVFPTISQGTVQYRIQADMPSTAVISVFNSSGAQVFSENMVLNDGINNRSFSTEKYGSGLYFVRLHQNGKTETRKFLIQ